MKISQEELAERAGLHRTYFSDIERGVRNPSLESIEKLDHALTLRAFQRACITNPLGLEVLRRIKQDPRTRHIPVVILTVSSRDPDVAVCRRLGAESYIVKPVGFENFSEIMPRLNFAWALLSRSGRPRNKDPV